MSNQDDNENLEEMVDMNNIDRLIEMHIREHFRNNVFNSETILINDVEDEDINDDENFNSNDMFQSIEDLNAENILNFSMMFNNAIATYHEQLENEILNETLNESLNLQPDITRQSDCLEFKKEKYNKTKFDKYENNCSICLTEYEKKSFVSITKCNHLFHHDCIKEWSYYKDSCPVCREKLKE